MSFLRALESVIGMFQSLPGMLVSSLVIFFPVVCGGSAVRVCGELVEFGSSLVRVIWHGVSLGFRCILDSFHFPRCPIRDTRPTPKFMACDKKRRRKQKAAFSRY
jgi:hypothetical protein